MTRPVCVAGLRVSQTSSRLSGHVPARIIAVWSDGGAVRGRDGETSMLLHHHDMSRPHLSVLSPPQKARTRTSVSHSLTLSGSLFEQFLRSSSLFAKL